MDTSSALRTAISLHLLPAQYPKIKQSPLPENVHVLLLIAVGDETEMQNAVQVTKHPKETIKQAAISFIENILLYPGADSYRVLGTNPDASSDALRRNMALMVRYLHPDISHNDNPALVTRVTTAWNDLKTPEKRATYNAQISQKPPHPKFHARKEGKNQKPLQKNRQGLTQNKKTLRPKKKFSYRRYWKGIVLRKLTLFLMKISGR